MVCWNKFYKNIKYSDDIYLSSKNYVGLASNEETSSENLSMKHLFDGDDTTVWHTNYREENKDKFITWHFEKTIDISKLEYLPYKIEHTILEGKILVSDKENEPNQWKEIGEFKWGKNLNNKFFYFDKNTRIKHLKLQITKTSNPNSIHTSSRGFNIWLRNNESSRILSKDLFVFTNSEEINKSNDSVKNLLDDHNSIWHTKWDKSIPNPYLLFEFNEIKEITKIKYIPRQDVNSGFIKKFQILSSNDGINFEEIKQNINWENNKNIKEIIFNSPIKTKFIKLVNIESYDQHIAAKNLKYLKK